MRFGFLRWIALAFCAAATPATAATDNRALPPAVDLGILNITQDTNVWCWAAVAQQLIAKGRGASPPQCALVAMVHGRYPSFCCPHYERCAVAGSLEQIRTLIRNFGHRTTSLHAPVSVMTLYRTLKDGHPVILAIRNSPYSGHVVVLTGMTWVKGARGPEAVLHINDPMLFYGPTLPWRELVPRWNAAIVVY